MTTDWLARAQAHGNPVLDVVDETHVRATFVLPYSGDGQPLLAGDFNDWQMHGPNPMTQAAPGVYVQSHTFEQDAYIEYAFLAQQAHQPPADADRVPDPYNARRVHNGISAYNQVALMPRYVRTPLIRPLRGRPRGTVTRHVVESSELLAGARRIVYLYRPPVAEPVPLLLVWDGPDYLRRARLVYIVENLIARRRMRPIALAMVANGRLARVIEYAGSDATVLLANYVIVPMAQQQLDLLDPAQHPGAYGVMGASMGGLMALYTGLRLPHVFGQVITQSGAFSLRVPGFRLAIHDLVECGARAPLRIWQDVGRYEWLLEANRQMHARLLACGYPVAYREFPAGHNYTAWSDSVWRGLEHVFPSLAQETTGGAVV